MQDTVYDYDSVPVPQGLIAEPGGNIVGRAARYRRRRFRDRHPGRLQRRQPKRPRRRRQRSAADRHLSRQRQPSTSPPGSARSWARSSSPQQGATPDLRWRYALSATSGSEYFAYGDGHTFYPAEIGTYGLGFQTRAQYAIAGNVHFAATPKDDLSAVFLTGAAAYQQYNSPYQGLQWSTFNSPTAAFPRTAGESESASRHAVDRARDVRRRETPVDPQLAALAGPASALPVADRRRRERPRMGRPLLPRRRHLPLLDAIPARGRHRLRLRRSGRRQETTFARAHSTTSIRAASTRSSQPCRRSLPRLRA